MKFVGSLARGGDQGGHGVERRDVPGRGAVAREVRQGPDGATTRMAGATSATAGSPPARKAARGARRRRRLLIDSRRRSRGEQDGVPARGDRGQHLQARRMGSALSRVERRRDADGAGRDGGRRGHARHHPRDAGQPISRWCWRTRAAWRRCCTTTSTEGLSRRSRPSSRTASPRTRPRCANSPVAAAHVELGENKENANRRVAPQLLQAQLKPGRRGEQRPRRRDHGGDPLRLRNDARRHHARRQVVAAERSSTTQLPSPRASTPKGLVRAFESALIMGTQRSRTLSAWSRRSSSTRPTCASSTSISSSASTLPRTTAYDPFAHHRTRRLRTTAGRATSSRRRRRLENAPRGCPGGGGGRTLAERR